MRGLVVYRIRIAEYFRQIFAGTLGLAATVCLAACDEDPGAPGTSTLPVASIVISPSTVSLLGGESTTLAVRLSDSLGEVIRGRPVEWMVNEPAVGAIRANGASATVMGLFTGSAVITAASENKQATANLVVRLVFESVSAGSAAAPCATTPAHGAAFCWGNNHGGRLGTPPAQGPQECNYSPCSTRPMVVPGGVKFTSVTASTFGSCGLASSGQVHCWGDSAGVFRFWTVPSVHKFIHVSASESHFCALATNRTAHCWGDNSRGQLGNGGLGLSHNVPRPVSGGHHFQSVSAGMRHSCGVTTTGAGAKCTVGGGTAWDN
jgi:hypothetical protein